MCIIIKLKPFIILKGKGHGHFYIGLLVLVFSLGDAETQNSIFIFLECIK